MTSLRETSAKLTVSSRRHFTNPHDAIDWPDTVDKNDWCMSPELTSLYGTETWNGLDEGDQRQLCFWETVNFFSVNLHGESALLEGIARRVNLDEFSEISEYLRHFIDEENKHSMWFARFCNSYAGKIFAERKVVFLSENEQTEQDFLFFAQITLFEELVDKFNVFMAADERLNPVVREINRLHHADESRHLQFGRKLVEDLWAHWSTEWSSVTVQRIAASLDQYLETMWRQLYNPAVYAEVGLDGPARIGREAWVERAGFRAEMSAPCLRVLQIVKSETVEA